MKVIFVLVFVCFINYAQADNYYFSALSGNDSRTTTEARDPSTPWRTLSKLNAFFSSLKPGDAVYLKRGETFYGSIIVSQSGSTISPILIGAYGTGDKPVITSLVKLTGWVSRGNGVWESYNASLGSSINMVLLNGVAQEMGRYPNSDAANKGYLNFESHEGKTSITDNQLSSSINWKGAELVLRPRHWILHRSLITAHSGRKISYTTSSPYEPYENYGYFIQNSIKTLDQVGEWYYNPSTHKLSAYFGTKGPSSYVMEAATTMGDLVSSVKYSNVTFDNLVIKGSNGSGFNIINGSGIYIKNCDILFSGINGVLAGGHPNLHVENCTIANSNNNAIDLPYGVSNALIKNNKILNTALMAGMMPNGEGNGLAIYTNGSGNTIEYNEIRRTGFIGITFYGSNVTIKNNLIDSFCFVKDDGGGIYTHGEAVKTTNRKLIGNIITDGVGAGMGTDIADKRAVTGIYMDANTTDVDIRDNSVTGCHQGIMIQSTTRITIKNNTVFNNVRQMVLIRDKDNNPVRNSIITQNIFFSKSQIQWALYVMSSADDIKLFGRLDSNYYARPLDDRITIYTNYTGSKGSVTQNLDLDGWKEAFGHDIHSKRSAKQIAPYKINNVIGLNKFINGGDFNNDVKGVAVSSCTISRSTSGMLDGGYLQVVPSATGSSIFVKVGQVSKGKNYILSYSVRGSVINDMSIGAVLKQSTSPYTALTQVQSRKIDQSRSDYQILFTPLTTESSALAVFKVDDKSKYYFDNFKFNEVSAQITNPDDSIRFDDNATKLTKSINLNSNYIDTRGKVYSGTISLPPYASLILIKTGAGVKNIEPTITLTASVANNSIVKPLSVISINAKAADIDGSIEKIEFYNGSTLLLTEYKAPYDCVLGSLIPGNYTITAKATDDKGLSTTSSPVKFSVAPSNIAPVVSITSPGNNLTFTAPATIEIVATATDKDGTIEKIEFYNGSALLIAEFKVPYTYIWKNVPAGTYSITAKATDNKGLTKTSAGIKVAVTATQASRGSSQVSAGLSNNAARITPAISGMQSKPGNNTVAGIDAGRQSGASELSKLSDFRVSPNPAVNTIQLYFNGLQVNQKVNLAIQNVAGAVVKRYPVNIQGTKIDVDVSSLIPGMYIIGLSGANFTINKRFLKVD